MAAQDNEITSRRITVFPQEPDRTGKHAEVVDASPLIYLVLGGISLLLASAIGFFPMHSTAAGILFLGIFLIAFVSLVLLGSILGPQALFKIAARARSGTACQTTCLRCLQKMRRSQHTLQLWAPFLPTLRMHAVVTMWVH